MANSQDNTDTDIQPSKDIESARANKEKQKQKSRPEANHPSRHLSNLIAAAQLYLYSTFGTLKFECEVIRGKKKTQIKNKWSFNAVQVKLM